MVGDIQETAAFGNRFGDLPTSDYLEFTVPTPGVTDRGKRRIVARLRNDMLFFTTCHYERVQVQGADAVQRQQVRNVVTGMVDPEWQNGFYLITGLSADFRTRVLDGLRRLVGLA